MLQAISKVAEPLKPDLRKCASSSNGVVESGKNFLFWFDKANNGVEDANEKVKGKSSLKGETQNTRYEEDSDLSKLQRVIEEMGLSYFFVLEDNPNIIQSEPKASNGLSIPLREASQLLAELGFSSEDILSLQTQLKSDGSLDLQTVANFLSSQSPVHENATIDGNNLSKLLSAISLDANPLHFSLDPEKEFSIEETRNILGRVLRLSNESGKNLETETLDISSETKASLETTFNSGTEPEDKFGVRQRDLKDAFARTVVGALQTVEEKEVTDQQDINTETESYRVNTKAVNEKIVFVKSPEMITDEEPRSTQDSKAEIRSYEESLKENNYRQSVIDNPLNSNYVKEKLFDYEMQTRTFQSNPRDYFERGAELYRGSLVDNGNVSNALADTGQNDTVKTDHILEDLPLESDARVHNNTTRVSLSEALPDSSNGKYDRNFSFQTQGSDITQSKDIQDNPTNGIQGFAHILAQDKESSTVSNGVGRIAIVAHVAEQITQMKQLNQNRLVLQLDPPELGRVVIKVSVRDNKVSTSIAAENEEIRDLLNRNTEFLRRYLEEQGLFLDEFSVETSVSDSSAHSGSRRDHKFTGSDSPTLLQSFTSKGVINLPEFKGSSVYENREHLIYLFA